MLAEDIVAKYNQKHGANNVCFMQQLTPGKFFVVCVKFNEWTG